MSQVWLNGSFVSLGDAKISAFDAGLQHGVGLFETMLARGGRVLHLDRHLQRLDDSARELRLTERLHLDPLREAIELTLERNGLQEARVRLTLTGGDLNLLQAARQSTDATRSVAPPSPTILIHAQPPQRYPEAFFEKGVTVTIANGRLNPLDSFQGHKTLNYWPRLRALQDAATVGAGEAIWFTVSNHLAGGSVSNVFLVKDGALLTPIARGEEQEIAGTEATTLPSPVLPGVTRGWILREAGDMDLHISRRMLDINDLLGADEVFLTNASWGILPVAQVEREKIGAAAVGEVTRALRVRWLAL